MGSIRQPESLDFEKMYIESLEKFVTKVVSTMATSISLQPSEALNLLEGIHVEMLGELNYKIEAIKNNSNNANVKHIGAEKLSWEIEKAIKAISVATDLNTDEITSIFSNTPDASLEDVSYRLRRQSAHDRFSF
jgi:hypothetical protein